MHGGLARSVVCSIVALVAMMPLVPAARAGDKSLIAALNNGDELRYTYTARNDETSGITGNPGLGAASVSTETVGLVIRCKADTTALRIIEVTYESFRLTLDSPAGKLDIDLGGPSPGSDATPLAREVYASMHGIVGLTLTLNTAPGSGDITLFHGDDGLLKSTGVGLLRRYLERDYFTATFGPIFQLKSNSAAPPPGQEWWMQRHIFSLAHAGKTSVWETRVVETVLADISTVKGKIRATGNPEGSEKAAVFFKSITGEVVYKWDMFRSRLLSVTRTESVSSRFASNALLRETDVKTTSTLEFVKPAPKRPEPAAQQPTAKPIVPVSIPASGGDAAGGKPTP